MYKLVVRNLKKSKTDSVYHYDDIQRAHYQYEAMNTDDYRFGKSLWFQLKGQWRLVRRSF